MKGQNQRTAAGGFMGPSGNCICLKCGFGKRHERGIPCQEERCPKCNAKLVREGSYHHKNISEAKKKREDAKTGS